MTATQVFVATALAALLTLAPGPARPAAAAEVVKFPVGAVSKTAADWPEYVAVAKGFYAAENIAPEVTYVGNVANAVQQTVGGSYVLADSTFDTAVRAIAKGANVVMIGSTLIRYPYSVMVAPGIHTAADLKGKRIILPFSKDFLTVFWNRWTASQGVAPEAIEQVYDGATPNPLAALMSGGVQAAALTQPFDFRAADQGYGKLVDLGEYAKDFGFLVIVARPEWLAANGEVARAYLRAQSKAIDWIYDPANRAEAIDILARSTATDPAVAARTYDYFVNDLHPLSRKLAIPDQVVKATVDTLVELGDIERPTRKFVDLSFLPQ